MMILISKIYSQKRDKNNRGQLLLCAKSESQASVAPKSAIISRYEIQLRTVSILYTIQGNL